MKNNLREWIDESYVKQKTDTLKNQFISNIPFPHLVLLDFFNPQKAVDILKALAQEPMEEKEADLFKFMQTKDLVGTNNKVLTEFRSFLCSDNFVSFMEKITGLKLKRGVIDLHGTLYQDTDFLLCHDDQLEGRKIAFLFYLSNLTEKDGGSLNLFNSKEDKQKKLMPTTVAKKIIPQFNTFAFFEVSHKSFHEVEEVVSPVQRIAIGGWFHGD